MAFPSSLTYSGRGCEESDSGLRQASACHHHPHELHPGHSLLSGHPEFSACPGSQNYQGHCLCSFANLAHLGSGTETSDQRERSHEVCFFLFVLLDKSIISSPLPGLWEQCNCSPNSTLHPPPPGPSGFPLVPLPHSPSLCTPDNRPLGSSCMGPRALVRVGCCPTVRDLFLSLSCFQPTLEQREARINSQTDTKQRDRDSDLEASHRKDGVRVGGCPRWQGP